MAHSGLTGSCLIEFDPLGRRGCRDQMLRPTRRGRTACHHREARHTMRCENISCRRLRRDWAAADPPIGSGRARSRRPDAFAQQNGVTEPPRNRPGSSPSLLSLSYPTQTGEGLKRNIERMKQSSAREIRQMPSFTSWAASARSPWFSRRARKPWSLSMRA